MPYGRHRRGRERLRLPLSLGVTVIAAHGAGSGRNQGEADFERLLRLRDYQNFYVDISALTQLNRPGQLTRPLQCRDFHGRLLYGSDMPLVNSVLVSFLAFPFRLSLRQMIDTSRIRNCWDRDLDLKEKLGLKKEILADSGSVLKLPPKKAILYTDSWETEFLSKGGTPI